MQVLTVEQVAKIIHKSVASIRNDRVRNPSSLPPFFSLPGSRRLLVKSDDLNDWIEKYRVAQNTHIVIESKPIKPSQHSKRGRPTNSSTLNKI